MFSKQRAENGPENGVLDQFKALFLLNKINKTT
jgi:hypothetical protein